MRLTSLPAVLIFVFAGAPTVQAGEAPIRLTNIINSYPSPSPDGQRVVFQSNRTGRYEIYVMNIDGSGTEQLTDRAGDNVTAAWSPDGQRIAFAANDGDNSDIYLMNADGGDIVRLTEHPGDDSHPHWSGDGSRIIFNSPRTTPDLSVGWLEQWHEVFSMKHDGSDLRQHTENKAVCTYPSFSPDGTRIVYRKITNTPGFSWNLSSSVRNSEVFVADADGGNEVNLSNSAAFDGWPVWSPDGRRVVFASNRAGPANVGHLYVINADGSGLQQITRGSWSYVQPAWSGDGARIFAYQNQETADFEFGDVVIIEAPTIGSE
jgi:Tol biopolymer transport system component